VITFDTDPINVENPTINGNGTVTVFRPTADA